MTVSAIGCARNYTISNDEWFDSPHEMFSSAPWNTSPTYDGAGLIENTYVNDYCMQSGTTMYDCGALHFYSPNSSPVVVTGDYVHGAGIATIAGAFYPDDGPTPTSNIQLNGNVIDGIPSSPGTCANTDAPQSCWLFIHASSIGPITATGNYVEGNYLDEDSNTISGNTTLTSDACNGGALTACQAIIDAAGIQSGVTPGP